MLLSGPTYPIYPLSGEVAVAAAWANLGAWGVLPSRCSLLLAGVSANLYCQPHFEDSLIVVLVRPPVAFTWLRYFQAVNSYS